MVERSRRRLLRSIGAGAGVGLAGCLDGGAPPEERVQEYRDQLSAYSDVARAAADGYEMAPPYLRADEGVVGMPFVNYDEGELDPETPNMLLYDLAEDGTYKLLGAKWYVPTADAEGRPSLFGRDFDGPFEGRARFVPEHYGLFAWLFEDNPEGIFAEYHPGVSPPSYLDQLETLWDHFEEYTNNAEIAVENGYENAEVCTSTADGGYGIPVVNTDATGTDLTEPAVLLYKFASNWNYFLQGFEWYVPADEADAPPSMFGQEFHGPEPGHGDESDQPEHYGLHAWPFTGNPDGMFAKYNPLVECREKPDDA